MNSTFSTPQSFLKAFCAALGIKQFDTGSRPCLITRSLANYGTTSSVIIEWVGSPPRFPIYYGADGTVIANSKQIKPGEKRDTLRSLIRQFIAVPLASAQTQTQTQTPTPTPIPAPTLMPTIADVIAQIKKAALMQEYVTAGYALVSIPPGQKGPVHLAWNEWWNAVITLKEAATITGNVGLAHAYCTPHPCCAIDIDNYREAKPWFAEHGVDLDALLVAEDAVVIASGKKYSLKLLYRLPQGPLLSKAFKASDGSMMVEFRCASTAGKTLQDVLPPSIHPSGSAYQWVGAGSMQAMPFIPDALLSLWQQHIKPKPTYAGTAEINIITQKPETAREVATIKDLLVYISADCTYENYRNVVWAILSIRWNCSEELALDWSVTAPHRFEQSTFDNLVNSYNPQLFDSPTVGSLYYLARQGGWNG